MRSCQLFSLAVVALSVVSMTGCAHAGLSQAAASGTDLNAPVVSAMNWAAACRREKSGC